MTSARNMVLLLGLFLHWVSFLETCLLLSNEVPDLRSKESRHETVQRNDELSCNVSVSTIKTNKIINN